jgi:glycosyltransferase involved in cell wall biosynthesis
MLSICIPVYNYDVVPLVNALVKCIKEEDNIEILVADDGSRSEMKNRNSVIKGLKNVHYLERTENTGRSAIRNFLAKYASKDNLLFIDADSSLPDCSFIEKYQNELADSDVVCGGTSYDEKPKDKSLLLRYVFGINREARPVEERMQFPYRSFSAHNFCIKRALFLAHPFDEGIKSYGHEDTLLGLSLKKRGIQIKHIDNPLIHTGLEPALEFIDKTNTGLENLILLLTNRPELNEMAEEVKVLRYFFTLKRLGLISIGSFFYAVFKKRLLKNLTGKQPSLFYFDLYKLTYLCARYKRSEQ